MIFNFSSNLGTSLELHTCLLDNSKSICTKLTYCRAVHLLVEKYNAVMRTLLFAVLLALGILQVISVVNLVLESWSSVPIMVNLFYGATFLESFLVVLVGYGFAGDLHLVSKHTLARLKAQVLSKDYGRFGRKEHKYKKAFVMSCQVQKIKFGLSNFIEKTTPPVFQLFCSDRIVDLLLAQ